MTSVYIIHIPLSAVENYSQKHKKSKGKRELKINSHVTLGIFRVPLFFISIFNLPVYNFLTPGSKKRKVQEESVHYIKVETWQQQNREQRD